MGEVRLKCLCIGRSVGRSVDLEIVRDRSSDDPFGRDVN